jgi:YVTN family beta-propeller protein
MMMIDNSYIYTTINDPFAVYSAYGNAINADGQLVGQYVDSSGLSHAVLHNNDKYTVLNDPLGKAIAADGAGNEDQVVGQYADSSNIAQSFLYSKVDYDDSGHRHRANLPKVVKTVIGKPGAYDVTVDARANKIYVANFFDNSVSVMDGYSDKIIKTIPVGLGPTQVVVDEGLKKIYVMNLTDGTISLVNTATGTVTGNIALGGENIHQNISLNHKTHRLYANSSGSGIIVIDGTTNTVLGKIPGQEGNGQMAIDEKRNIMYAGNYNDATVSVIDLTTETELGKPLSVGHPSFPDNCYITNTCTVNTSGTDGVNINQETNKIYVQNINEGNVVIIDGNTRKVTKTIPLLPGTFQGAVDPGSNTVYLTNFAEGTLTVIDGHSDRLVGTVQITTGFAPAGCYADQGSCTSFGNFTTAVGISELTHKLYVVNQGDNADTNPSNGSIVVLWPAPIEW